MAFLPTPVAELAFQEIERDPWREPATLRVIYLGGAQLRRSPPPMMARVLNLDGPTEATVASTWAELQPGGAGLPPIGVPLPGTRVRVVDPNGGPSPTGVAGELVIGGDKVALGHFDDPERTCAAFRLEGGLGGATGQGTWSVGAPTEPWTSSAGWTARCRSGGSVSNLGRSRQRSCGCQVCGWPR